jgi:hypothetical protein
MSSEVIPMITESDVRALRYARSEFSRRWIDVTRADVRMMHGVLHVKGTVAKAPGAPYQDLHAEMEHVMKALRGKPEVRDVVLDVAYMA